MGQTLNDLESDVASLIRMLNIKNIFPPQLRNPKELLPSQRMTKRGILRPPRPQNAFFIFRKNVLHEARIFGIQNMRLICKASSFLWKNASDNDRKQYKDLAEQVSTLHRARYPGFKYTESRITPTFRPYLFQNTYPLSISTSVFSNQMSNVSTSPNLGVSNFSVNVKVDDHQTDYLAFIQSFMPDFICETQDNRVHFAEEFYQIL
ncbi:hypothetical protein G9A89_008943 [Geosiphon pyriformis]|nr:hypothetical protein G9A89_008943 [Geosiphon pyriformis]